MSRTTVIFDDLVVDNRTHRFVAVRKEPRVPSFLDDLF